MSDVDPRVSEFDAYVERATAAVTQVFALAKAREEVQFAWALNPEFRGMQDPGWSTADDAVHASEDYRSVLQALEPSAARVRVALAYYSHMAEAAGFYEMPKNMLRIASGFGYNLWPFRDLVRRHRTSGDTIAPNANAIMKDLLGHASELGQEAFCEVILETFDFDLRNAIAHADYIIWTDGIRMRRRNGGTPRICSFAEFENKLNKAIAFFEVIESCQEECIRAYHPPRIVVGPTSPDAAPSRTRISFDPTDGTFEISIRG